MIGDGSKHICFNDLGDQTIRFGLQERLESHRGFSFSSRDSEAIDVDRVQVDVTVQLHPTEEDDVNWDSQEVTSVVRSHRNRLISGLPGRCPLGVLQSAAWDLSLPHAQGSSTLVPKYFRFPGFPSDKAHKALNSLAHRCRQVLWWSSTTSTCQPCLSPRAHRLNYRC